MTIPFAERRDHLRGPRLVWPCADLVRCISLLGCTPALPFLVTCCFADSRRSFGSSRVQDDYAYAAGRDDRAVHVAQQGERVRLVEGGVAEGAVAADPEDHRAPPPRLHLALTQAGQLRGSDAAPVVAVEAEANVVPAQLPERDRPPLGAGQLELGRGLGRRLATFLSIPYAAFSRTRHGDSSG